MTDPLFSPLVERAVEIAAEWHDRTYRKGRWSDPCVSAPDGTASRVPAMAHVTTVAVTVQRAGWGDEAVAAAFLHDTLEDPDQHGNVMTAEALAALVGGPQPPGRRSQTGEAVVRIVEAVTEPKRDAAGEWLPWRVRKEAYLDALRAGPAEGAAVSLADKLHNAFSMASSLEAGVDIFSDGPGRRALSADAAAQVWFFHAALDATRRFDDPRLEPMRDRLAQEVRRFGRAAGVVDRRGEDAAPPV